MSRCARQIGRLLLVSAMLSGATVEDARAQIVPTVEFVPFPLPIGAWRVPEMATDPSIDRVYYGIGRAASCGRWTAADAWSARSIHQPC